MATPNDKTTEDLHPKSTYNSQYPYNHVTLFDDGSEIHVDTTPGAERFRIAHGPSGTYWEVNHDGRLSQMVTNRMNTYVKGGMTSTVDGNVNEKVGGSSRSSVHGDSHSEVQGLSSEMVGGDKRSIVSGDHVSAVGGDAVHGVSGKAVYKYGGGLQMKFDGSTGDHTTINTICDTSASMQFGQDVDFYAKGPITIRSDTSITIMVGSSSIVLTPSNIKITSGTVNLYASQSINSYAESNNDIWGDPINLNGGGSTMPPMSIPK